MKATAACHPMVLLSTNGDIVHAHWQITGLNSFASDTIGISLSMAAQDALVAAENHCVDFFESKGFLN